MVEKFMIDFERLNTFDLEELRKKYNADEIVGYLNKELFHARALSGRVLEALIEAQRTLDARKLADLSIGRIEQLDHYYRVVDMCEDALRRGWSKDKVRQKIKDGIGDEEYEDGQFFD